MSRTSLLSAGNAGGTKSIRLNGNQGGGNKLQGLIPSIGKQSNINYNGVYGTNRDVVFRVNQLGGIGRTSRMFSSSADGVVY